MKHPAWLRGGIHLVDIICPPISKELITYLETVFPDKCPDLDYSDRQVWIDVGAVKVTKHLRAQYLEQSETVLSK